MADSKDVRSSKRGRFVEVGRLDSRSGDYNKPDDIDDEEYFKFCRWADYNNPDDDEEYEKRSQSRSGDYNKPDDIDDEEYYKLCRWGIYNTPDDDEEYEKRRSFIEARGLQSRWGDNYPYSDDDDDEGWFDDDEVSPRDLGYVFDGNTTEDIRPLAEMALSSYNEKILAQQGTEYELVEVLECVENDLPDIYHFNFIAKPKTKNESKNKEELFFGEVKWDHKKEATGGIGGLGCSCCCIVGPFDTETGLGDCRLMCVHHQGRVKHPVDGFTKDVFPDSPGASPAPIF